MKQTRKRQTMSNTSHKLSVIRKAFSNRKTRRGIVGGAWSTKDLLTAMVVYGRKQSPQIVANVENESTKSPEDIVKDIQTILAPASKDGVLENEDIKQAIANYKIKRKAADKASDKAAKAEKIKNKASDRANAKRGPSIVLKTFNMDDETKTFNAAEKADEAAKKAAAEATKALNALYEAADIAKKSNNSHLNEAIDEAIDNAINETNPISDNSKQQLTIVLPFFLQIYESLYNDDNYEGSTQISRHTSIPNRAIMEYVVREIQKIEKTHPHPQLFESIFYFWNIFNLPTALGVMMAYLSEIPTGEASASHPGQVVTIVEKQLGNVPNFRAWDENTAKPHDYRIYTKIFGQKFNPVQYADGALIAMANHPFTTYNPHITRSDTEINVNEETGAFRVAEHQQLPLLPSKNNNQL